MKVNFFLEELHEWNRKEQAWLNCFLFKTKEKETAMLDPTLKTWKKDAIP